MQFNKDELKQILVNTKDYERNDYLDKYVNLIWENREQIRIKYFTQKHHFIPVSHYGNSSGAIERKKVEKIADADSFNFRINLLYKDHILAHYYLSKCAITYKAISSNCKALRNILRNNIYQKNSNYIAEKELLLKLEDIQQAYVKGAKAYELSLTEEQKKQRSLKHSEIQKRVAKEYTEEELDKINIKRKASWESHEEEVKKEYSERKKKEVSERWSKRTPEYREAIRQKIIATKKAKSEEQKRIDIEKQWLSFLITLLNN